MSKGPKQLQTSDNGPYQPRSDPGLSKATAHEVANVCDAISNLLHLVKSETGLSQKGHEYLQLALEELARIAAILNQKVSQNQSQPAWEYTEVSELVSDILSLYRSRLEVRRIRLDTRFGAVPAIKTKPHLVREIVANLLLNAVDATPEGGSIAVRVSAARDWRGDERSGIRVTVADSGSGIPAHIVPRIFERFFTTRGAHGHGVGLSLVNQAIQKLGGSLRLRTSTRTGRSGTVFVVLLPALPAIQSSSQIAHEIREKSRELRVKAKEVRTAVTEMKTRWTKQKERKENDEGL